MGVFDKLLDIMKLNDTDDYDDDFYEDDLYEDDFDTSSRRPLFKKKESPIDDSDDFDVDPRRRRVSPSNTGGAGGRAATSPPPPDNKVTPMRQFVSPSRKNTGTNMEVRVVKPTSIDDSREISETLLAGRTVILNLEGLDLEMSQRIIDFVSGATYALGGNLQRISNYIFLVTPNNVEITGDLQDLLGGSMETSNVNSRF